MARLLLSLLLLLALSIPTFSSALPGDHSSRFGRRPKPAPVVEQPPPRGNLLGGVFGVLRGAVGGVVGGAAGAVGYGIRGLARGGEILRPAVLVTAAASLGLSAVDRLRGEGAVPLNPLAGLCRAGDFWIRAAPLLMRYRIEEQISNRFIRDPAEKQRRWDRLHDRCAPKALASILALRGFYIKVGQVASSRNDFMPMQIIKALSTLQDDVPGMPQEEVRRIVNKAFGEDGLERVFSEFDFTPLGAASIGQCHAATLRDTGEQVCVKVQSPNAPRLFRVDLQAAKIFCRLALPEFEAVIDELERQFLTEFDYRREAHNLITVGDNMRKKFSRSLVVVPRPVERFCTSTMLVMERLPGVKLAQSMWNDLAAAIGAENADDFIHSYRFRLQEVSQTEGRVNPSCFPGGGGPEMHLSFSLAPGTCCAPYATFAAMRRARRVLRTANSQLQSLLAVHGHQILINGEFNGDPHPGNILVMPSGALGLIDYGQVKRLTDQQRLLLARMIVALGDGDEDETRRLFVDMGFRTKQMNPLVILKTATLYFDRDGPDVTGGMDARAYFESLQKMDATVGVPDDFVMAARVALLLRGLGSLLGQEISVAKAWRPLALQALRQERWRKRLGATRRTPTAP